MAFVHYRSPATRPGHVGQSMRTRSVATAWVRARRFLAECTDDPTPHTATLRVDVAVDDVGSADLLAADVSRSLGPGVEVRSGNGKERGWEWSVDASSARAIATVVAACEQHEARPRIHVNEAVRRHGSPPTPQVWATIAYDITLRCAVPDTHDYRPGWGQSQLRLYLGFNELFLVLHFPFGSLGPELEDAVRAVEQTLGLTLSRRQLALHAP